MRRASFLAGSAGVAATLVIAPQGACAAATLRSRVLKVASGFPGAIGVYARAFGSDAPVIAYRAYERFPTASIIKLLVMTTAYATEEVEPGTLERRITFNSGDLIAASDFMSAAADGQTFSVRELIVPMIQVSDNTAANLLIDFFGITAINEIANEGGMTRTQLGSKFLDWNAVVKHSVNVSTPADMARLLYLIERGAHEAVRTIVSAAHCRAMIEIMLGQTDRDAIPAALPAGTPVANKTGAMSGTRNDVAIVDPFGDAPWILTIMTKDAYDYPASYNAMHAITRATFDALGNS